MNTMAHAGRRGKRAAWARDRRWARDSALAGAMAALLALDDDAIPATVLPHVKAYRENLGDGR